MEVVDRSFGQLQKQEQRISASIIQGLNMLSLPTQAMYNYLAELSLSNPMLDIPELPTLERYENIDDGGAPDIDLSALASIHPEPDPGYFSGPPSETADNQQEDFDPYYSKGIAFEADTLIGSLKLQLSLSELSGVQKAIGQEIIENLDDSGYFIGNLDTICLLYCQSPEVGKRVLETIQQFQPKGIAAANVYEALTLQVEDTFPHAALAKRIITENLRAVCDSAPADCAALYGVSEAVISEVFDYIRSLEPKPGNSDPCVLQVQYIQPDIIVKRAGENLQLYLLGDENNPLHINEYYLELMDKPDLSLEERQYLLQSLNAAKALIHSVDVRRQTLHKAALALVSMQRDFFLYGPEHLRPLTMQQMAREMGVNVSTVSRIVQDKYVSTRWGLFPLKSFFVRALKGADDEMVSAAAAKERIEKLIAAEDSANPLTDDEICTILGGEGYRLSRRTVSKYRQAAGIPGCVKRRYKKGGKNTYGA